jgi:hypothetical protein
MVIAAKEGRSASASLISLRRYGVEESGGALYILPASAHVEGTALLKCLGW